MKALQPFALALILPLIAAPVDGNAGSATETELVEFGSAASTIEPSPFKVKQARKKGITLEPEIYPSIAITGLLQMPEGPGPFPAVILLHGCAGVEIWNSMWSERLAASGYAVLSVDSFTPRGLTYICDGREAETASPWARALDAFGARAYLSSLDAIDPSRIAVMGMSHGGASVLEAIQQATPAGASTDPFRAAIAFYPLCNPMRQVVTPALILIGDQDRWVSSDWCAKYVDALPEPHDVTLEVFQGAHHLFDVEGLDTEELGFTLRYHPDAARKANEMIRSFLTEHLDLSQ